jgi:hypothetical protein
VILDTTASTAARAAHMRSQERCDLSTEDLTLHFQQERLGLLRRSSAGAWTWSPATPVLDQLAVHSPRGPRDVGKSEATRETAPNAG